MRSSEGVTRSLSYISYSPRQAGAICVNLTPSANLPKATSSVYARAQHSEENVGCENTGMFS